ncbi:MAG: cytochrome c [Alphaproteobacteria bacterium]|jgi:cytochrome c|nr:cytochrome c [Alphaproteobacteria bacterium]
MNSPGNGTRLFGTLVALGCVAASGAAHAAGDAVKGKVVFQRCAICHRVEKDGGNGLGPNLFRVVGRKAGRVANFSYSSALKSADLTWTQDKLIAWVAHPSGLVPGNRMAFAGLPDPQDRADVVAYLATLK